MDPCAVVGRRTGGLAVDGQGGKVDGGRLDPQTDGRVPDC